MIPHSSPDPLHRSELALEGMSCASCAGRIQRSLNNLPGVEASINFATARAEILHEPTVSAADLVGAVESAGYFATPIQGPAGRREAMQRQERERKIQERSLLRRLVLALLLGFPVMLLSMVPALQFPGWGWWALAFSTPVIVWCAYPFHREALRNLRRGAASMDTLVSVGVLASFFFSLAALVVAALGEGEHGASGHGTGGHGAGAAQGMRHEFSLNLVPTDFGSAIYFEVAVAIVMLILGGRFIESRSLHKASSAIKSLALSRPEEANLLLPDGQVRRIRAEDLKTGERFLVRAGERLPADGVVIEGAGPVDSSMLTGESLPDDVEAGAEVRGGSLLGSGWLTVEARAVGEQTYVAGMIDRLERTQQEKDGAQRLADRISSIFVPAVLLLSLLTFLLWMFLDGSLVGAVNASVAVLIIACPCALGLATPAAMMVGSGRAAQMGLLIKGPLALEAARNVTTIFLDKTGTLTRAQMRVTDVIAGDGVRPGELLERAALIEHFSDHPLAQAIVREAKNVRESGQLGERGGQIEDIRHLSGMGMSGKIQGKRVFLGRPSLMDEHKMTWRPGMRAELERIASEGSSVVAVGSLGQVQGLIALADEIRPEAASTVEALKQLNLTPILLTGDHERSARTVARKVGIDKVISGVLPGEKADVVRALQREGKRVAMLGDGMNDSLALAQADLGIALEHGSASASEVADMTVTAERVDLVPVAIKLSREISSTIRTNLVWAFAYNIAALPLAALGLLNPMIAAAAMAFSSLFVIGHSLRLRRFPAPLQGKTQHKEFA